MDSNKDETQRHTGILWTDADGFLPCGWCCDNGAHPGCISTLAANQRPSAARGSGGFACKHASASQNESLPGIPYEYSKAEALGEARDSDKTL